MHHNVLCTSVDQKKSEKPQDFAIVVRSGYGFHSWSPEKARSPNTSDLRKGLSPFPDFEQMA